MKNLLRTAATASMSYAHLLGFPNAKKNGKSEEEEQEEMRRAEEEEEEKKKNGKKSEKEKTDEDEDKKDGEDEKPDKEDKKSSKEAKEGDDEKDEEEEEKERAEIAGNSATANIRRRERARCTAIFLNSAAAGRPHIAAKLAFHTAMTAREAIAVMESLGEEGKFARHPTLAARMNDVKRTVVTPTAPANESESSSDKVAQRILNNRKKVSG